MDNPNTQNQNFSIRRINLNIGAEVSGIDLSKPLSSTDFQMVHTAWIEHEVLVFRDQKITIDNQAEFAKRFGTLSVHPFSPNMDGRPEVIILDNHKENPPRYTDCWHSDETFRKSPPMGTMLRAEIVPEIGGDTLFSSMTAAYAGLSPRLQHYLTGLEAIHDFGPFQKLFTETSEDITRLRELKDKYPHPIHPVIRKHPVNGKPIINVNPQFTVAIKGMPRNESRHLLDFLFSLSSIPEYQLRLKWAPNTIVLWENRSVQHYAVHDYYPQRRKMIRVTIEGDMPIAFDDKMSGISRIADLESKRTGLTEDIGEVAQRQAFRNK